MPDNFVTQINVDGTICEIKDSVARTDAASAKSTADTALNKVTALEQLPRVTVTYSPDDTTIKVVTTNTHTTV